MSQDKLVIVGVGALGSHVVMALRNMDKYEIKIIDFDHVEQKNTQAQFHTKMGLRKNKAKALQMALRAMFNVFVEAIPHKLADNNAEALLGGAALVIDCTDNIAARRVISTYVRANDIPCLHGALSADGTFARVIWNDRFKPDAEGEDGQATCEDGEALPFFFMASAVVATTAQTFLNTGKQHSFQITPGGLTRI